MSHRKGFVISSRNFAKFKILKLNGFFLSSKHKTKRKSDLKDFFHVPCHYL